MADKDIAKVPESASDEEKGTTQLAGVVPHEYTSDLQPDPDAHLSPEERAAIVRFSSSNSCAH